MPSQAISASPSCGASAVPSRRHEARRDPVRVLLDPDAAVAGDEVVRPDPLERGGEQHLVQVGAMDREMRPLVPGGTPPRLAIDELPVPGEERIVLRLAGARRQGLLQPQRAQLLHGVRPEIDADAERADLGRRFEHADAARGAGRMERQRQRQSADAAADDQDFHSTALRVRRIS